MPRKLGLREVSEEEANQIRRLASSRTQQLRLVQRARIIQLLLDNPKLPAGKAGRMVGYKSDYPGRTWVKRFNEHGLKGFADEQRSGRSPTYDENTRSCLINMALQKPDSLGYPFALWTENRLQALEKLEQKESEKSFLSQIAFQERYGLHLSTYTIWTWVTSEGLKWKRQQSWFHDVEKHDPEFVEKRGPSFMPTPMQALQVPHEPG